MLFDTLRTTNSSIKGILLSGNEQINDECMKSVGEYVKSNKSIEVILLARTKISDAGIEILAPYLDGNTTFEWLYLKDNNGITDKSIPLFLKIIESSHIQSIDILGTSISQKKVFVIPLASNTVKNGLSDLSLFEK